MIPVTHRMSDGWEIWSGVYDHFIWDKDRFRLVIDSSYPVMTVSDHRNRRPGEVIEFCSLVIKNWEWASSCTGNLSDSTIGSFMAPTTIRQR